MRKDGVTRGFGFVTFADPLSVEKVLVMRQVREGLRSNQGATPAASRTPCSRRRRSDAAGRTQP